MTTLTVVLGIFSVALIFWLARKCETLLEQEDAKLPLVTVPPDASTYLMEGIILWEDAAEEREAEDATTAFRRLMGR